MGHISEVEVAKTENQSFHYERKKMEKYTSENTEVDEVYGVHYPNIKFKKEDGTIGMEVSLKEIVDVWLQNLELEQESKLEHEENERRVKRDIEWEIEIKKWRERNILI